MKKELICISCPRGCRLSVEYGENQKIAVTGNSCPRGEIYAVQELTDPRRTVTAAMKTDDPAIPYIAVRTDAPFHKKDIDSLLNRLYKKTVHLPISRGEIIWEDIDGSGINIISSETV